MQDRRFIETAIPWIMDAEGGFVNDVNDRGGATKYGISLKFLKQLPDHDGDGFLDGDIDKDGDVDIDDIRNSTKDDAIEKYWQFFWRWYGCEKFDNDVIALCFFDALVNHGPGTAKRLLQRGLHVKADGVIGPITMKAANAAKTNDFLSHYCSYRAVFFRDIVISHPEQDSNFRGWMRRLFLLQQYIYQEVLK